VRALLIEDDKPLANTIELMLRSEGIEVCMSELGDDGILLSKLFYDVIVLDLQLPDMSGFDVLQSIRFAKIKTPVLILSGNAITEAKVRALGYGADDYMTKPFHKDELVARIHAIVRRSKGHSQFSIANGALVVDLKAKAVEVEGVRKQMTIKQYEELFHAVAPFLTSSISVPRFT
jgi:two-component system, cell cycle response regulator CtrA